MKAANEPFSVLLKYLPDGSLELLLPLLNKYAIQLKISKPRKTKFGDYRFPKGKMPHRISVNGDLNPFAFLITLIHEYAHLVAFDKFGKRIKAHGSEWQFCFKEISEPFLQSSIFPIKLQRAFRESLARGHASSATDHNLLRVLKEFDTFHADQAPTFVEDVEMGSVFVLNDRIFRRGPKSRKRFKCEEIDSGRQFMVHPLAEVGILNEQE
jgi:SprT protein